MPTLESNRKNWIPQRKNSKKVWSNDPRYHTQRWRNYRKVFIVDNPLCVECRKFNKTTPTTIVGHIIPVSKAPDLFWEPSNHKALCRPCNNRQSVKDRRN